MRKTGSAAIVLALVLACSLWATRPWEDARSARAAQEPPVLWDAPVFSFIDQDDRQVGNADLCGRVWVCDFFLTNCAGICPRMTDAMLALQRRLDPSIQFVSFTVDPLRDTPDVLKAYAKKVGADESRWRFLTTEESQLRQTAAAMRLITPAQADDPDIMLHSDKFFLIDQLGRVRGVYESKSQAQCDQLVADARRLVGGGVTEAEPLSAPPSRVYEMVEGTATVPPTAEALARDLVCGMDVQACAKAPSAAHQGRSYYFCNPRCREKFERDPGKYLGSK